MQILFGVECVDRVALQALLPRHSSRYAWEIQEGDRRKDRRMVYGFFDFKPSWRGGEEGRSGAGKWFGRGEEVREAWVGEKRPTHPPTHQWSVGSSTSIGEEDMRNKSLEAESKELRARIEALEKKEGEGVQGRARLPSRRESDLAEEWRVEMDLEDEAESRKKLDQQKRKLQKELRDIEKFSCVPKEFKAPVADSV